jgi:hypothetical protein
VAVVHTHGPKPHMVLCVIEFLKPRIADPAIWSPHDVIQYKQEMVEACNLTVALYFDQVLKIMAGAFKADGGAMYRCGGGGGVCCLMVRGGGRGCLGWERGAMRPFERAAGLWGSVGE